MIISIIVAVDEGGGIGFQNKMPWHLPADLKRFKTLTMGHHLVMGRKTFQSIGAPLPGRKTIILSRNPDFRAETCQVVKSLHGAIRIAKRAGEKELFVIGGAAVYARALAQADHLYLTRVHSRQEADTFFPGINDVDWIGICSQFHPADDKNPLPHTFIHYVRSRST
jgi:dihydrofolate reductase